MQKRSNHNSILFLTTLGVLLLAVFSVAAQNTPSDADQNKNGVFINRRPMKDFGAVLQEKVGKKEIDLGTPFKVMIAGELSLANDKQTVKILKPKAVRDPSGFKNDPAMEKFVQDAILAVSDAGWFGYLYQNNVRNVVITVEQDDKDLTANIECDQPSEVDAKRTANALNSLLAIVTPTLKPDEKLFLSHSNVSSNEKTFRINFNIPKPLVQELIKRKLEEAKQVEATPAEQK